MWGLIKKSEIYGVSRQPPKKVGHGHFWGRREYHIDRHVLCLPPKVIAYQDMGVDQKVLTRSSVFGDHSSLFKSLRERSAMEFAKETVFSAKDSALGSWMHPVHLHICRTRSLVDR